MSGVSKLKKKLRNLDFEGARHITEAFAGTPAFFLWRARVQCGCGEAAEAATTLEEGTTKFPGRVELLLEQAGVLFDLRQYQEMKLTLERVQKHSPHNLFAAQYLQLLDFAAQDRFPKDFGVYPPGPPDFLARLLLSIEVALPENQRGVFPPEDPPENLDNNLVGRCIAWYMKKRLARAGVHIRGLLQKGKVAQAEKELCFAKQIYWGEEEDFNPLSKEVYTAVGEAQTAVLEKDPAQAQAAVTLLESRMQLMDWAGVAAQAVACRKILLSDEQKDLSFVYEGTAHYVLGEHAQAIAAFEQVRAKDQMLPPFLYAWGMAHLKSGHRARARFLFALFAEEERRFIGKRLAELKISRTR